MLATTALDLFIVAGQSNAVGHGATASALTPSAGSSFDIYNQTFKNLADPVGNADLGSAWPKYCTDYYAGFTRKTAILGTAVDGSAQAAAASSDNWDLTGSLYANMVTKTQTRIEYLNSLGITVTLRGILWDQGERDATAIDTALITKAVYKAALENMITRIQVDFPGLILYVSRTGAPNTGDTAGFVDVRAAQDEVCTASAFATMAFTDAVNFPGAGKMQDTYHYTTVGYNEMGAGMAASVILDNPTGIVYAA